MKYKAKIITGSHSNYIQNELSEFIEEIQENHIILSMHPTESYTTDAVWSYSILIIYYAKPQTNAIKH